VDSVWASPLKIACLFALLLLTDRRMTTQGWVGFKQKGDGGETYLDERCEARWQPEARTSTIAYQFCRLICHSQQEYVGDRQLLVVACRCRREWGWRLGHPAQRQITWAYYKGFTHMNQIALCSTKLSILIQRWRSKILNSNQKQMWWSLWLLNSNQKGKLVFWVVIGSESIC
jgi:hypothetical protein